MKYQGLPYIGADYRILDEDGKEIIEAGIEGYHCLKLPGPITMITCLWKDDYEATKDRYYTRFPGYFFNGDMGMWDENRCYRHMRRTDDLIRINYKKTSVKFLNTIMNSYEGVEDSMIMSN